MYLLCLFAHQTGVFLVIQVDLTSDNNNYIINKHQNDNHENDENDFMILSSILNSLSEWKDRKKLSIGHRQRRDEG